MEANTCLPTNSEESFRINILAPPPNPEITLPIIIGLSRRSHSSQKILKEAIIEFQASILINGWLLRTCKKRRNSKFQTSSENSNQNPPKVSNLLRPILNLIPPIPCHRLHWIFRCLLSPSIRVRRYASQVILEGWKLLSENHDNDNVQTLILFQVIHYLLNSSLDFEKQHSCRALGSISSTEGGDPMVQLFGLLNFLLSGPGAPINIENAENETKKMTICDNIGSTIIKNEKRSIFSTVGTGNHKKRKASALSQPTSSSALSRSDPPKSIFDRKKKTGSKNKNHVETGITAPSKQMVQSSSSSSYSSKSFVSCGGLRWVASRALFLVAHLVSSHGGAPINDFHDGSDLYLSESANEAIHIRIALLIDLCHRLLTSDFKTKSQNTNSVHSLFWTSNISALKVQTISLTPLAVFICIHEILKTGKSGQFWIQSASNPALTKRGVDKTLASLARIVDPTFNHLYHSPPSNSGYCPLSRTVHKFSSSRSPKKKRKINYTTSRTRPSSSNRNRDSSSLETLPPAPPPLSFSFGRSSGAERITSDTAVAAAVNAAISGGVDERMEDIEEGEPSEEEDDDEDHAEDDNSDNNEDQEDMEEAMIILEDDHGGVHAEEAEEEEEDDEEDGEHDDEEEVKDSDEEIQSEDEVHDEDMAMEHLVDGDIHGRSSSPQAMDFEVVEMEDEEDESRQLSNSALTDLNGIVEEANQMQSGEAKDPKTMNKPSATDRKHAYLQAAMQVLESQHSPAHLVSNHFHPISTSMINFSESNIRFPLLSPSSERSLVQSLCDVVRPPPKPLNLKIYMRRAPTQEEFFRGSLSKNPIAISSLSSSTFNNSPSDNNNPGNEPTFKDLRKHIANDLQMSDSAELLELLVAGKIISMSLKVRAVQQVLWRRYVLDNSNNSNELSISASSGYTSDTETSSLPAMIVTYRLAGVDGEATEDKVEESDIADPLANSMDENRETIEKEFGVTKIIAEGRGIPVLLKSIEKDLGEILRKIRRDAVAKKWNKNMNKNPSLEEFAQSAVGPGLILLKHCSRLKENRRKMVQARAPSLLLRLLLDVLNATDNGSDNLTKTKTDTNQGDSSTNEHSNIVSSIASSSIVSRERNHPTANALQELIETLATDISGNTESEAGSNGYQQNESDDLEDVSLPLLLNSLKESCLSAGFRLIIANLLPFLTYGQTSLSRTLASEFVEHVNLELLCEKENAPPLMMTFVDAAINLPSVEVCNTLRLQLINQGFVKKVVNFIMEKVPSEPPTWSPALLGKKIPEKDEKNNIENAWRTYLRREGLQKAFKILIGLCNMHNPTQNSIAEVPNLLKICHWIENTSDTAAGIDLKGIGLLGETLLDAIKENNEKVDQAVEDLRGRTKERKKEIAEERRNRALIGMNTFVNFAGVENKTEGMNQNESVNDERTENISATPSARLASMLNSSFAVLASTSRRGIAAMTSVSTSVPSPEDNWQNLSNKKTKNTSITQPSWLAEMEAMEDEAGLTCAVCHEGVTFKPSELLGLYSFVKKISIPQNKGGAKTSIDGTHLFISLPSSLPDALVGTEVEETYFRSAKTVAKSLNTGSSSSTHAAGLISSSLLSSRPSNFLTTVTAGTAIHCTCHSRARQADRNHPKAPKSEWEGASLRNSRVTCNIIIPLVTSNSSQVPLVAVESGLTDYQTVLTNTIGGRPKSMLWTVLHDVRFLLLRIAYGESLNADCGGGSLASNASLVFYLLCMAKMFSKHAEHGTPSSAQHARCLGAAFISACEILKVKESSIIQRPLADAAPMAGICAIIFYNGEEVDEISETIPPEKRQWSCFKHHFLNGLIRCAGRRKSCGIEDSGCIAGRAGGKRSRSCSFVEWDAAHENTGDDQPRNRFRSVHGTRGDSSALNLEDYAIALRPFITFYAMLNTISQEFEPNMDDEKVSSSAEKLTRTIGKCQRSKNIKELIKEAGIKLDKTEIMAEFEKGLKPF